jgi:two-component system, response regulator YesN
LLMYRMMIVEDEEIERKYLCRFVDWKGMGIEVIAALESGEEALEFAETSVVDILLTDIKLIGISGLQLAKKLLERKPAVKVVILSGYQEFEYAKEAVELQAFSFLTKPVDLDELGSVFQKVVDRCLAEQDDKLERERLYSMVAQNVPVLKSKFFDDLMHGRLSAGEIERSLAYFGLDMSVGCYNVLVFEIDSYESVTSAMEPSDKHLMIVKILDCINSIAANVKNITFHVKDGRYCTLLSMETDSPESLYPQSILLAEKLQERLNAQLKLDVTVGVGKGVGALNELKVSYKMACDAVAFRFYMGSNQIIHYNDVYYDENSSIIDLDETGRQIVTAIGLCDRDNLVHGLSRLFEEIKANSCTDTYIRNLCINLVSKVSVMLQDMHESFGKVFGNEALVWEKLLKLDTIFDLQLWLRNIFSAVIDYLTERKCGSNKKIITDILKYIDANYHKNISITDISQEVYLSPNYISIIFKKETGEAFTNFLIRYRMEKAVQMLKDTNLKVYEIGDRVGYSNTSHFCTAFKKLFGVSPNEYRDKI